MLGVFCDDVITQQEDRMPSSAYHVYVRGFTKFKLIVLVLLIQLLSQSSQNILYVSKARGHDGANGTNNCQNMTRPCQTLNHVINMTNGNDVIKMDPNNTIRMPYNRCPTRPITGKLSFSSWNEMATINCSGKGLHFEENFTAIEFHNIKFLDTFLSTNDVSLTINNCSFRNSFKKDAELLNLINVSVTNRSGILRITITSTNFLEKNNAALLNVVNNQRVPVFVEIRNVTVSKNFMKKANYIISMQGYVNFNFTNSDISNTTFSTNLTSAATLVRISSCSTIDQDGVVTFSLRELNFSFNQGRIVHALFRTTANVSIIDTTVSNNTDKFAQEGAFVIKAHHEAAIKNNLFVDNIADDDAESESSVTGGVTKLLMERCVFLGNLAEGSGAISVAGNISCHVFDSVFHGNNGMHGPGAIDFSGTNLFIKNCTLDSNNGGFVTSVASTLATGSISLANGSLALIKDSKLIQRNAVKAVSNYGKFHGTLGLSSDACNNVTLLNSTLDYEWSPSLGKVIVLQIVHTTYFVVLIGTTIRCPPGYKIRHPKKTSIVPPAQNFECELCTMGSYSIDRGVFRNNRSNSIECLLCPYGGRCTKGLRALPNFWGYQIHTKPPTIQFSRCPTGYCCQGSSSPKGCFPYDTCNTGRRGRLCGVCMPGYTETLFTPSCRKSEKCTDYWFWPLAVIFVLGFTLYLIIQPDIPGILYRSITWFRSRPPQITELGSTDFRIKNVSEHVSVSGLERIVFFYYQAMDIISIQGSYNTIWDNHLTQFVVGIFNFDMRLNRQGFACPFPGLDPVSKLLFHTLGVFSVLFAIPCIFLFHKAMSLYFSNQTPKNGLYLSVFLKSVILGYTVLARKSLTLLQCVVVNGVNCLFVNCNIECYTWWQQLIGTLVLIYFFPFVLVLFFGAKKLYKKQISVVHFFFACLFPLPFLSYWFLNRHRLNGNILPDTDGRTAVTSILIGSYRVPDHVSAGAIHWESVLIGRMLLLILAFVLIMDPLLKALTLLLCCIINLSLHIYVRPYERIFDNRVETISLFCLVLTAMFNLPFMAYLSEGVVPTGPISHVMDVFMWCQVVLIGFLPVVCVLLVVVALFSQAARLVFLLTKGVRFVCACLSSCRCFGKSRTHGELDDSLIT